MPDEPLSTHDPGPGLFTTLTGDPSISSTSDTSYASSELPHGARGLSAAPTTTTTTSSTARTTRSYSLAAVNTANTGAISNNLNSIKRKPLASTASPLATRFSAGGHTFLSPSSSPDLPKPDVRLSRSFSVDSPTLYEYPVGIGLPPPLTDLNIPKSKGNEL
jgi:hypothetical protein